MEKVKRHWPHGLLILLCILALTYMCPHVRYAQTPTSGSVLVHKMVASQVLADSVLAVKVAALKVTADSVLAVKLAASQLTADSILAVKLAASQVIADSVLAKKVEADRLTADSILAIALAASQVTADSLLAIKVEATKAILDSITAELLAATQVTADSILAFALAASQVTADSILAIKVAAAQGVIDSLQNAVLVANRALIDSLAKVAVVASSASYFENQLVIRGFGAVGVDSLVTNPTRNLFSVQSPYLMTSQGDTLVVQKSGCYWFMWKLTFVSDKAITWRMGLRKNGVLASAPTRLTATGGNGDTYTAMGIGYMELLAGDRLGLVVANMSSTKDIILNSGHIIIVYLHE